MLFSLLREKSTLTSLQVRMIAGILTDLTNPSVNFLNSLVQLITEKRLDPEVLGAVCIGSGSLGSKADIRVKNKISKTFTDLLENEKYNCGNPLLIDVLEAVGNLACRKTVPSVLEVSLKIDIYT